jgi:tetratricopeptide (TPR) repeat protein
MLKKRSPWISVVLAIVLLALLGFSGLPRTLGSFVESEAVATNMPNIVSESGLFDREASGYESVLEREPDNDFALSKLLEIRLQQKDFPKAIAALERLVELHPEQTQYRIFLAKAKLELKDSTAAEAIYRQVLQQEPNNLEALSGIVALFLQQEKSPTAISFVERILQETKTKNIEIDRTAVELLLAGIYSQQQNFDRAFAIYDRLALEQSEDFRPLLSKALLLQQQGKKTESKEIFDRASAIAPEEIKDRLIQLGKSISAP